MLQTSNDWRVRCSERRVAANETWKEVRCTHLEPFRQDLEKIAIFLSTRGVSINVRYNAKRGSAEFVDPEDNVLLEFAVFEGPEFSDRIVVTLYSFLDDTEGMLITRLFSAYNLKIVERALAG